MCGIAGFWADADRGETLAQAAAGMCAAIRHRGPDDLGVWTDPERGLALGQTRLSIIDISPHGHQPMVSAGGRFVITFNGEVYNFAALRAELGESVGFRGHSDTEVMLACIERWGLEAAVRRFVGMFAFALWDRQERELHLVRDRVGIKPLYYGWSGRTFLFGSQPAAIRRHPSFDAEVDREALMLLLKHKCIPAPFSIYQGIRKLTPGTILTLSSRRDVAAEPRPYWSARGVAEAGVADLFAGSDAEATAELERLLSDAIGIRMISDVPLGAFLSGGVDSSVVVALMQAQSVRPVRTFSIGFESPDYNEADHARAVARHLGTEHTELILTEQDALDVIPDLPTMFDEPFADSSQIPTHLVSSLARRHVTVSLSGDGGDELFGGYNRYLWGERVWNLLRRVPLRARQLAARGIQSIPADRWDRLLQPLARVAPGHFSHRLPGYKLHKLSDSLRADSSEALYFDLISLWKSPESVLQGALHEPPMWGNGRQQTELTDFTARMMYYDLICYLPDDILTKVDRASMAVALEARVPLLDHRLIEFAWRLPAAMKVRDGQSKWLLRQVLYRHIPRQLVDRPKMGFGIPLDSWLRTPLRAWAEELLDEKRLKEEGIFEPAVVRGVWNDFLASRRSLQYHIWAVLMFQAWHEAEGSNRNANAAIRPTVAIAEAATVSAPL